MCLLLSPLLSLSLFLTKSFVLFGRCSKGVK